jgi:hypothetical protein
MKTSLIRVFAQLSLVIAFASPYVTVQAQLDIAGWTQIGNGVISSGRESLGPTHNRSGKAIQASWTMDAEQCRKVLYVGTAYGGLWKSMVNPDGDIQYWKPLTDNFPGPHAMGSFLVNPVFSEFILIGPGLPNKGEGDGNIYRTHSQGAEWSAHALPVHDGERRVQTVYRIQQDRSQVFGNIVIACTDRGIYRSEDFGLNWHRVFKSVQGSAVPVFDAVQDVKDPQRWLAAAKIENVILESTNNGETWNQSYYCPKCIPGPAKRVSLATCDADENILFALVANEPLPNSGLKDQFDGLYRSTTRGQTWEKIFHDAEAVDHAEQGGSNNAVACDPSNPNHVIFGCKDQLETFTALLPKDLIVWDGYEKNKRSNLDLGHGDLNFLLFRPGFESVVVCNDGGYYIYHPELNPGPKNVDDSGNLVGINALWLTKPQGCLSASRTNTDRFIGGLQDNGVVLADVGANTLTLIHDADGAQGSIMPDNDSVMTTSATGGQRSVSYNSGSFWFDINFNLDSDPSSFPSIQIDPTPGLDNPRIFTHSIDKNELSHIFFRPTLDPFVAWEQASHFVLQGVFTHLDHTTNHDSHEIIVTREDRRSLWAYVGPRGQLGNLQIMDITPPLPDLTNGIKDAHANADKSGLQPDTLYYTTGLSRPSRAFISNDGGHSWIDVTGDLPQFGPDFNKLIGNPRNLFELFLATSKGVYHTVFDFVNGFHWVPFSEGLRLNEEVQDIVINVHGLSQPTLYIGTKGRGFWQRVVGSGLIN